MLQVIDDINKSKGTHGKGKVDVLLKGKNYLWIKSETQHDTQQGRARSFLKPHLIDKPKFTHSFFQSGKILQSKKTLRIFFKQ